MFAPRPSVYANVRYSAEPSLPQLRAVPRRENSRINGVVVVDFACLSILSIRVRFVIRFGSLDSCSIRFVSLVSFSFRFGRSVIRSFVRSIRLRDILVHSNSSSSCTPVVQYKVCLDQLCACRTFR